MRKFAQLSRLCVLALSLSIASQVSATELVKNGNFQDTLTANSSEFGSLYSSQQVTDWTTSGYNFVFTPGTAATTGALNQYSTTTTVSLWGNGNGANNGFTGIAPGGGNIIGADGAYQVGAISQSLTGLTVGSTIAVSFNWAGIQQYTFSGPTTESWTVSLGSQSYTTNVASIASHGFSGWMNQTFDFVATSSTETLSFLAHGTPSGEPPFSLLANVSAQAVSPAPLPLLGCSPIGVLAVVALMKKRNKKTKILSSAG